MIESKCSVRRCDREVHCAGMCNAHRQRWNRGLRGEALEAPIQERSSGQASACCVDGCSKRPVAHDLCGMHYYRLTHWGEVGPPGPLPRQEGCSVDGCGNMAHALGLCPMHYQRQRTIGEVGSPGSSRGPNGYRAADNCNVKGCDRPIQARSMCSTHYKRWSSGDRGIELERPIRSKRVKLGTTSLTSDGYVKEKIAPRTWILQHRLVMEQELGRALRKGENVHHINGDRTDNRIENLELWSSTQPKGQRVDDKIAWARETLSLYDPAALATPLPIEQLTLI